MPNSPFKFLDSYIKADREIFFGRENNIFNNWKYFVIFAYKLKINICYAKSSKHTINKPTIRTIENLSYVSKATIYIQDPADKSAIWGYRAWRWDGYKTKDGFARFFVAKDFEIAMRKAFDDNSTELVIINENKEFEWYFPIKGKNNKIVAIVRIDGNKKEDFREYKLGL